MQASVQTIRAVTWASRSTAGGLSLPSFYERLRLWLGTDLLTCQQGHHRPRDERAPMRDGHWHEQTAALRDEDLWLRLDRPEGSTVAGGTIFIPFVERRAQ